MTGQERALRVAIAGGGVGGLVAAVGLRRAGLAPVVLERADDLRQIQIGGSIHLWPNGMRALRAVGLYDAVLASVDEGASMTRQQFMTSKGRVLADWQLGEAVHGAPTLAVVRGELHAVLLDAVRKDVRLSSPVEGFTQDGDGVVVRGPWGEERFDVLIGADGLYSAIRQEVVGDGPPRYAGYTTCLAILPSADPRLRNTIRINFGAGKRFVAWPVAGGRVYWEAIMAAPEGSLYGDGRPRAALLEDFADWADPIPTLIEATPDEAVHRSDAFTRVRASRWGEGRVTMLGDAAHAMTNAVGQGANQALEDAVVLAGCLAGASDPVAALRRYEELRRKRAESFISLSRKIARMALVRWPPAVAVRNMVVRGMSPIARRQQSKDAAYDAGAQA